MNGKQSLVFRVHAIQRMFERAITKEDVRQALATGKTIEAYPEDQPYPSRLVLGWPAPDLSTWWWLITRLSKKLLSSQCMSQIWLSGKRGLREGGSDEMRDL